MGSFKTSISSDGWTTNDLIYKWKEINPVQLTKNLSLPGGFKLANYSNHNCDVVTATGRWGRDTDCHKGWGKRPL